MIEVYRVIDKETRESELVERFEIEDIEQAKAYVRGQSEETGDEHYFDTLQKHLFDAPKDGWQPDIADMGCRFSVIPVKGGESGWVSTSS